MMGMLKESGALKVTSAAVAVPAVLLIVMVPEMLSPSVKLPVTLKVMMEADELKMETAARLHNRSNRDANFIVILLPPSNTGCPHADPDPPSNEFIWDFHFGLPASSSIRQVASIATKFLAALRRNCTSTRGKWAVRLPVGCQPATLVRFGPNSRTLHRPSFFSSLPFRPGKPPALTPPVTA